MGAPPQRIEQRTHESEPPTEGRGGTKHARSVRPALGCGVSFASFLCPDQRKEGDTPEGKRQPPRGIYLWGAAPNINELTPLILAEKWLHLNSSLLFFFGELVGVSFDDLLDVILEPALRDAPKLFVGGVR